MIFCRQAVLTASEARELVRMDRDTFIGFARLTSTTVEVAKELAQYDGCLCLNCLVDDLTGEVATALANHTAQGGIFLDKLTRLLPETAEALADYKGGMLSLNGVTSLSDDAAVALGRYLGRATVSLHLRGLRSLSYRAAVGLAKYLGRYESSLDLDGLTSLSIRTARELAKCRGILHLQGVRKLSEEVQAILKSSPAICVVLNDKYKHLLKKEEVPADCIAQLSPGLKINMVLADCIKANPNSRGHVCLDGIEQLPYELTAMYFAHVFGDHSLQYGDSWLFT